MLSFVSNFYYCGFQKKSLCIYKPVTLPKVIFKSMVVLTILNFFKHFTLKVMSKAIFKRKKDFHFNNNQSRKKLENINDSFIGCNVNSRENKLKLNALLN